MKPTTHPIGPGTVNLSVNVLREWRLWLGRIAFRFDASVSAVVRAMLHRSAGVLSVSHIAAKSAGHDADALTLMRAAQSPDSPGGEEITREEGEPIAERISQSEYLDRQLAVSFSDMAAEIKAARKHQPIAPTPTL